jgi:hypothetical protein
MTSFQRAVRTRERPPESEALPLMLVAASSKPKLRGLGAVANFDPQHPITNDHSHDRIWIGGVASRKFRSADIDDDLAPVRRTYRDVLRAWLRHPPVSRRPIRNSQLRQTEVSERTARDRIMEAHSSAGWTAELPRREVAGGCVHRGEATA